MLSQVVQDALNSQINIEFVSSYTYLAMSAYCERQTALGPGAFFDAPAHFRLGYGGDTEKLRQGLARVSAALQSR